MGIPVDVTFHPGWWSKHAGINFGKEFFCDSNYRIECDRKMRKILYEKFGHLGMGEKDPKSRPIMGTDLLASGYLYSTIMGCRVKFFEAGPPEVICANISEKQIKTLAGLDISKNKVWRDNIRQFEYLKNKFGYVESHINLQGIQNIAVDLRGSELFIDYIKNPELARTLINTCTEFTIQIGKYISSMSKVLSHGVTAITKKTIPDVYVTSNCTVEMISEKIYECFLLESDIRLSSVFKPFGIHHCGQTMEHVCNAYAKIKNLSFAEVGAGSDINRVRQILSNTFINLRYSPVRLKIASDKEIAEDVEAISNSAGSIFSISCVGIDSETEDHRVESLIKHVRDINL